MLALYPGLDWFTLLPVSLSLGCAALTIGMGLNWWRLRGRPAGPAPPRPSEPLGPALLPLAAGMGSLLALVIAVAWSLKIAAAGAIVMLAPLAAAAMSLLQATPGPNRAARGLAALRTDYLRLPVLAGEVTLFMAAGCGGTVIASAIPPAWTALVGSLVAHSPTLACLALMSAVVALSCMAVHPVLSVVLIASSFPPALLGLAPLPHLASILVGSAVASTVSPFSMISLMASRYSGLSVYAISVQTNRAFTLLCLGLAAILLGTLA